MKRFLIIFSLLLLHISPTYAELDYNALYKDTPILDYMYEASIDNEESNDYKGYVISPYVLVRLPVKLRNKNVVLKPGYYLVKPENKNGYRFAIFKQKGVIVGVVPIYSKSLVNPETTYPQPPKPNHKWFTQPFFTAKDIVSWPFKKLIVKFRKVQPPPRAKADFRVTDDGQYYEMWLYVEENLYKILFKLEQ